MIHVLTVALLITAGVLVLQDWRNRLLDVWLLLVFLLLNISLYVVQNNLKDLLLNFCFTVLYVTLCTLSIKLYYYCKSGKREKLLDEKIGSGDLIVSLSIGLAIEPETQIPFFTVVLLMALAFSLLLRERKSIPLAGYLLGAYMILIINSYWVNNLS